MVAEVAQGLHHRLPRSDVLVPSSVRSKLLIVFDKRLQQATTPSLHSHDGSNPQLEHVPNLTTLTSEAGIRFNSAQGSWNVALVAHRWNESGFATGLQIAMGKQSDHISS